MTVSAAGAVEVLTRREIRGWVAVTAQDILLPVSIALRLGNILYNYDAELTPRADLGGRRVGFRFLLDNRFAEWSCQEFAAAFGSVAAEYDVDGARNRFEVPLHSAALVALVEDARLPPRPTRRRLALLLRTHLATQKALDLAHKLQHIKNADLIISVDETNKPIRIGQFQHLAHDINILDGLGLAISREPSSLFFYGDMPFYHAAVEIPNYDHYLMIEYDMDFDERGLKWLQAVVDRLTDREAPEVDFFAPDWVDADPSWHWTNHAYMKLGTDQIAQALFPLIGLSRAAAIYLLSLRLKEPNRPRLSNGGSFPDLGARFAYCEYFVPTSLRMAGIFSMMSAADISLPWRGEFSKNITVDIPLLNGVVVKDNSPVSHPVLDWDQFLGKLRMFMEREHSDEEWLRLDHILAGCTTEQWLHPLMQHFLGHPQRQRAVMSQPTEQAVP